MTWEIKHGDWIERLKEMPNDLANCCVTSPPYWGLRDYGVPGQLGLERTPDEYVAKVVEGFREVRRVLRKDGTLWLNLGDSYAQGNKGNSGEMKEGWKQATNIGSHDTRRGAAISPNRKGGTNGLCKPKDLVGIPWMVAFALRAPYYTGKIKNEMDRVWLAAMVDAEGCMFIHRRKAGQHNGQGYQRQNDSYGAGMEVANCSERVVQRCMEITGVGSICSQGSTQNQRRKQTLYRWNLRSNECRSVIEEIYPYLVAKQQQARLVIGCPSSGERAAAAHAALIGLHNGIPSDVDSPAPEPLFQQGFYLRQDCIWSKSNPMPESVTDRCTKAHEYLFLLSKSAKYYFDQEAIKELGKNPEDDLRRISKATLSGKSTPDAERNGIRRAAPESWNGSSFDSGKTGEMKHSRGGTKIKVPGGWDRGEGAHGTIHRNGRTSAEYQESEVSPYRNKRSVWEIATAPFPEAHFATFPPKLVEPCILAGCPEGGTVLDPFAGAGTTGLVATRLHRNFIGIELNQDYIAMASKRIEQDAPLFNTRDAATETVTEGRDPLEGEPCNTIA